MVLQVLGVSAGQEVLCVLVVQVDLGVPGFLGVQGIQGDQVVLLLVVLGVFLLQLDFIWVDIFHHLGIHHLLDLHPVILLLLSEGLKIFSLQVVDLYWGFLLQVGNHLHLWVNFHHVLQGFVLFLHGFCHPWRLFYIYVSLVIMIM